MNWTEIISVVLIALGLSADCFAVSLGIGAAGNSKSWKYMIRAAVFFGLFQLIMPLLGWIIGQTVVELVSSYDHWLAFALLFIVAVRMFWEFIKGESHSEVADISKWGILLTLSVATSIDALAVGLSFAMLKLNILISVIIIGVVAFFITLLGLWLGKRSSALLGRWALLAGSLILVGIGIRILITHMLA
jgi:manganese efflux pump family protein